MNKISKQDQSAALALLERGYSQNAVTRTLGLAKNTVTRVAAKRRASHKIGRPSLGDKAKGKIVPVRLTPAEYELFTQKAKNCKSLSEWIRRTLRKAARDDTDEKANN